MTAVHEIGHWCGLYHTFQGGCEAPGDDVTDTPFEEGPAAGCPIDQPSSCPGETRFNPVENYMDYSDDAYMKHFTPQQIQRVRDMVGYYLLQIEPANVALVAARATPPKHRVRYRLVLFALCAVAFGGTPALAFKNIEGGDIVAFAASASPVPIPPERWQAATKSRSCLAIRRLRTTCAALPWR